MAESALELVHLRNNFYRDNYRRVLFILLLMVVINLGLLGFIVYQAAHAPKPKFFATTADGKLIAIKPLTMPVVSAAALRQWANRAAVASYTYDFVHYRSQLEDASEYFTPTGWRSFEKSLQSSRNLTTVLSKKLVVGAVATGAPVILDQAVIGGRYAWKVSMPLLVTYQSASMRIQQPLVINMVITRVPTENYPQGIAIAQFYASTQSLKG